MESIGKSIFHAGNAPQIADISWLPSVDPTSHGPSKMLLAVLLVTGSLLVFDTNQSSSSPIFMSSSATTLPPRFSLHSPGAQLIDPKDAIIPTCSFFPLPFTKIIPLPPVSWSLRALKLDLVKHDPLLFSTIFAIQDNNALVKFTIGAASWAPITFYPSNPALADVVSFDLFWIVSSCKLVLSLWLCYAEFLEIYILVDKIDDNLAPRFCLVQSVRFPGRISKITQLSGSIDVSSTFLVFLENFSDFYFLSKTEKDAFSCRLIDAKNSSAIRNSFLIDSPLFVNSDPSIGLCTLRDTKSGVVACFLESLSPVFSSSHGVKKLSLPQKTSGSSFSSIPNFKSLMSGTHCPTRPIDVSRAVASDDTSAQAETDDASYLKRVLSELRAKRLEPLYALFDLSISRMQILEKEAERQRHIVDVLKRRQDATKESLPSLVKRFADIRERLAGLLDQYRDLLRTKYSNDSAPLSLSEMSMMEEINGLQSATSALAAKVAPALVAMHAHQESERPPLSNESFLTLKESLAHQSETLLNLSSLINKLNI